MSHQHDLTGLTFGRLTVVSYAQYSHWNCLCECGTKTVVHSYELRIGNSKSCGCLHQEIMRKLRTTHGHSGDLTYSTWCHMIERCTSKTARQYKWYAGKGITVCDRWRKFENFLADMGERPSIKHAIDREDPNGNYEPSNCSWKLKGAGKTVRSVFFEGKSPTEWAAELGLTHSAITYRIRKFGDPRKRKA